MELAKKYDYEVHLMGGRNDYRNDNNIYLHDINFVEKCYRKIMKAFFLWNEFYFQKKLLDLTIRKVKPDVIHAWGADFWGVLATSIDHNIPTIITTLGSDIFRVPFQNKKNFEKVKHALEKADIVHTTPSKAALDHLKEHFNIEEKKIVSLSLGIRYKEVKQIFDNTDKSQVRGKYSISEDELIIFAPRGMRPIFEPVFKLVPVARKMKLAGIKFKIVVKLNGNKGMADRFASEVENNQLNDQFILVRDYLSYEEVIRLFAISEILVSMSETDQIAAPVLEAMVTETVPILSNIEIYTSNFTEPGNVFFVDNDDEEQLFEKIMYVRNNYSKIKESNLFDSNKIIVSREYDSDKTVCEINDIYVTCSQCRVIRKSS